MTGPPVDRPLRVLPRVTPETEFFWTSGADGRLRFLRCSRCGLIVHPPQPACPICHTRTLEPELVSGHGSVVSFTVNHQPWIPGFDPPYVVALVAIAEQPSVRLMTNVVGCAPEDVHIGLPVQVTFVEYDDVWLPLFEPIGEPAPETAPPGAVSGEGRQLNARYMPWPQIGAMTDAEMAALWDHLRTLPARPTGSR